MEHGASCVYETIKPRKRRKGELASPGTSKSLGSQNHSGPAHPSELRRLSNVSFGSSLYTADSSTFSRDGGRGSFRGRLQSMTDFDDQIILSPAVDCSFDRSSLMLFSPVSFREVSPHTRPSYFSKELERDTSPDHDGQREEAKTPSAVVSYRQRSPGGTSTRSPTTTASTSSLLPDLAMIAPVPVGSPLLQFRSPVFEEFSDRPNRRALVDHFCNILSHLIVFREESGNPFQQLVLPLTRRSSPVMNSIYALASAHLEYRGVDNAEKSLVFHNRAIQGLAQLIAQNDKSNRNEILAAIMLLVYYEVVSSYQGHFT